jgi:glycosyltransferase involved in cell wall biosynthesis
MRVVHVDSAHEWRGSQSQVFLTAVGMLARGHSVTVACQAGGELEARARAAGVEVRPLAFGGDLRPRAILGLLEVLRETRPDVVHMHDPHATAAGVVAARLVSGVRPRLVASRRVPLRLRGALSRRKYAACDRVLAVSEAVARILREDGLPADRLGLVYEGVPDRARSGDGRNLVAELGLPAPCRIIGSVAALSEHKDHRTLLRAMPRVLAAVPDALLLVVGEGALRLPLEAEARMRGLRDRCVFTGFRSDVDRLMPSFSLLCLTSQVEGLGTTLLDAMCFSRPVVATATGGIPEAVRHLETGLLVPVGDADALAAALVDLLTDDARRERMGKAGRARFEERFTASRMVEETLRVYDGVCGSATAAEPRLGVRVVEGEGYRPTLASPRRASSGT